MSSLLSLSSQVDLTYDAYVKSFYYHEAENVFTNNNWTLSDEVIGLFQRNLFYRQHVRWNVQRYRPTDVMQETDNDEQTTMPLTQTSPSPATNQKTVNASHHSVEKRTEQFVGLNDNEIETQALASTTHLRKKRCRSEDIPDRLTRTQARMMKGSKAVK